MRKTATPPLGASRELSGFAEMVVDALPEAAVRLKFHNVSFVVHGKVFAFTRPEGLVTMKLPESRARHLVERGDATALVMGKRAMREWVVVDREQIDYCLDLLREACNYVASLTSAT